MDFPEPPIAPIYPLRCPRFSPCFPISVSVRPSLDRAPRGRVSRRCLTSRFANAGQPIRLAGANRRAWHPHGKRDDEPGRIEGPPPLILLSQNRQRPHTRPSRAFTIREGGWERSTFNVQLSTSMCPEWHARPSRPPRSGRVGNLVSRISHLASGWAGCPSSQPPVPCSLFLAPGRAGDLASCFLNLEF